ncbi:unnamed protein product [Gadus morhua 'NCC']
MHVCEIALLFVFAHDASFFLLLFFFSLPRSVCLPLSVCLSPSICLPVSLYLSVCLSPWVCLTLSVSLPVDEGSQKFKGPLSSEDASVAPHNPPPPPCTKYLLCCSPWAECREEAVFGVYLLTMRSWGVCHRWSK